MTTRPQYARNIVNMFNKLNMSHTEVTQYDTALRATGGLIPVTQAKSITRDDVERISQQIPHRPGMMLKFAWKTASRWDEMARRRAESFLEIAPEEIIIYLGRETKASRTNPFRTDLFCFVQVAWTPELASYIKTRIAATRVACPSSRTRQRSSAPFSRHSASRPTAPSGGPSTI